MPGSDDAEQKQQQPLICKKAGEVPAMWSLTYLATMDQDAGESLGGLMKP
jgi:hypothetical protein